MKNIILLIALLIVHVNLSGQAPPSFNYQAVARDAAGQSIARQIIGVRFTLTDANSSLLYLETHTPTTNDLGLFTLSIGAGEPKGGNFQNIDWSKGEVTLRIEMDPNGGDDYLLDGTVMLESVPFALYANKARPYGNATGDLSGNYPAPTVKGIQNRGVSTAVPTVGDVLKWNGTLWAPATDATSSGSSLSAGPGISISGNVISNSGDLSNTNEIQTLNVSGNQLSISNGNAVTLPSETSYWNLTGNDITNKNSGNVGIGTNLPLAPLHINNSLSGTEAMRIQGNSVWLSFFDGSLYDGFLWNSSGNIRLGTSHLNPSGNLQFYTYGIERITIKAGGKIGIGTSSPNYKLHVEDSGVAIHGSSNSNYGLYGYSAGQIGIYGYSNATGSAGIFGQSAYIGVEGITNAGSTDGSRQGIRGDNHGSSTGWAAYFFGNVGVSGSFSKGAGSFKIDHPLDPENKYLYHSFVESPDMKNIYDGLVMTDELGAAEVILPEWFEALNKDFRYQLTVVETFAQAIISRKIENNQFQIQTNQPNVEVSWQITGIRKDPYAEQNRIPVEEKKPVDKVGKYLHPQAYGKPIESAVDYVPKLNSQLNEN